MNIRVKVILKCSLLATLLAAFLWTVATNRKPIEESNLPFDQAAESNTEGIVSTAESLVIQPPGLSAPDLPKASADTFHDKSLSAGTPPFVNWQDRLRTGRPEDAELAARELLDDPKVSGADIVEALHLAYDHDTQTPFAMTLFGSARPEVILALNAFLEGETNTVRRSDAARFLQAVRNPEVNGIVIDGLERFALDEHVAPHYRDALARNMDLQAVSIIAQRVGSEDLSFEERSYLMGAIARVNQESSVSALKAGLIDPRMEGVRLHIISALAGIGSVDAVTALIDYAEASLIATTSPEYRAIAGLGVKGESSDYLKGRLATITNAATKIAVSQALARATANP